MEHKTKQASISDSKIIYLITPDFNSNHISKLLQNLQNSSITVRIQKQTDSLGIPLKHRTFVLVDNYQGVVTLGNQFSSLKLFIVGYPRKGKNQKNYYCKTPQQVIQKYEYFCSLPEYQRKMFSTSSVVSRSRIKSNGTLSNCKLSQLSYKSGRIPQNISSFSKTDFSAHRIDQFSKLFLYMKSKDENFLKYALKIAANNPIKFKTVEDTQELQLSLDICRSHNNYVLVDANFQKQVLQKNLENLQCITFCQNFQTNTKLDEKVFYKCNNQRDLIECIRLLGFQAVSLKDIDKSIVKYDNPVAMQKKILRKQEKKKSLHWINSQNNIITKADDLNQKKGNLQSQITIRKDYIGDNIFESEKQTPNKPIRKKRITKYVNEYLLNEKGLKYHQQSEQNDSRLNRKSSSISIQNKCQSRKSGSSYSIVMQNSHKKIEEPIKKIKRIYSSEYRSRMSLSKDTKSHYQSNASSKHQIKIKKIKNYNQHKHKQFHNSKSELGEYTSKRSSQNNSNGSSISNVKSLKLTSSSPAFYMIPHKKSQTKKVRQGYRPKRKIQSSGIGIKKQIAASQQYYAKPNNLQSFNETFGLRNQTAFFTQLNNMSTAQTYNQQTQGIKEQNHYQFTNIYNFNQQKSVIPFNHYDQFLSKTYHRPQTVIITKQGNLQIQMCKLKLQQALNFDVSWYNFGSIQKLTRICKQNIKRLQENINSTSFFFIIDEQQIIQSLEIINRKIRRLSKLMEKIMLQIIIVIFVLPKNSIKKDFNKKVQNVLKLKKVQKMLQTAKIKISFKPIYLTDYEDYFGYINKLISKQYNQNKECFKCE